MKQDKISRTNISKSISASSGKIISVLAIILLGLGAGFVGGYFGRNNSNYDKSQEVQQRVVESESGLISQIANDVGPSVVSVNVTAKTTTDTFFGPQSYAQESAGTGIIISEDGVVVTNRHVVPKGASKVSVTLSDGTELKDVDVIGQTSSSDPLDVAFLKINDTKGKQLKPAKLGDSNKVSVGDKVIAIGNALGRFQNTVTSGIISGYGRDIEAGDSSGGGSTETLQNLFQTDAAINEGNSGGPLVNIKGEVIGINTAVAGNGAENLGFAIPIGDVQGLINSVLKSGKLERPYLGVRYVSLTDDYAYEYNLKTKRGAYIVPSRDESSIIKDSPAEKAGLQEKDIITEVDGKAIDERNSLISLLSQHSVGDKVTLSVVRGDETKKIDVTLEAAPQS